MSSSVEQAKHDVREAAAQIEHELSRWFSEHALEIAAGAFMIGFEIGRDPATLSRVRAAVVPLLCDAMLSGMAAGISSIAERPDALRAEGQRNA